MKKYLSWFICIVIIIAITSITLVLFAVNYSPEVVAKRYLSNLVNNRFENCYAELYIPTKYKNISKDEVLNMYEQFRLEGKTKIKILKAEETNDVSWNDVDKIYDSNKEFEVNKNKYKKVVVTYKKTQSDNNGQELEYIITLIKIKNTLGFIPKYKVADNIIASDLYDATKLTKSVVIPVSTPKITPKATPKAKK